MIIDAPAVVAILFGEMEAGEFSVKIAYADSVRMSVVTLVEVTMVIEGEASSRLSGQLDAFLEEARVELVPVTVEQAHAARLAWREFGKGNHPARLNFGDCFVYALAKTLDEPLLFKGDDFALTDIQSAL